MTAPVDAREAATGESLRRLCASEPRLVDVRPAGEVVPGFVKEPRRNADDGRAIVEYNKRLSSHPALMTSIVPLRDGVAISVKR